jgi:hypothetical protein
LKHVVSISIGSSKRNHRAEVEILGESFVIERIGTDGDLERAIALIKELDGRVDAFGMGGIDLYVYGGSRRYTFRDAMRMAKAAVKTPIVDGSGLKNSLERWVVGYLDKETDIQLHGKRVLMVVGVDRFGMAEAFYQLGCDMIMGDFFFALGVPIKLREPWQLAVVAFILLPVLTRLPFRFLYPTGDRQDLNTPRYGGLFAWADVIAGDFHYIRRYMPERLDGKVIITNTVTDANVDEIGGRGAACLITTTPDFGGRSFGTNVIEAVLVAASGRRPQDLKPEDYLTLIDRLGFRPRVVRFASRVPAGVGQR